MTNETGATSPSISASLSGCDFMRRILSHFRTEMLGKDVHLAVAGQLFFAFVIFEERIVLLLFCSRALPTIPLLPAWLPLLEMISCL